VAELPFPNLRLNAHQISKHASSWSPKPKRLKTFISHPNLLFFKTKTFQLEILSNWHWLAAICSRVLKKTAPNPWRVSFWASNYFVQSQNAKHFSGLVHLCVCVCVCVSLSLSLYILVCLHNIKISTDVTMELLLKTNVIYPKNNLDQRWVVIRNENSWWFSGQFWGFSEAHKGSLYTH